MRGSEQCRAVNRLTAGHGEMFDECVPQTLRPSRPIKGHWTSMQPPGNYKESHRLQELFIDVFRIALCR